MDDDRPAEVVSTALILALLAFVVLPDLGYEQLQERLLVTAAFAVVAATPISVFMVYFQEGDSHWFGPWGPGNLLIMTAIVVGALGADWIARTYSLTGALYWVVIVVGLVGSVLVGAAVRAQLFEDWPPSEHERREQPEKGPPGAP